MRQLMDALTEMINVDLIAKYASTCSCVSRKSSSLSTAAIYPRRLRCAHSVSTVTQRTCRADRCKFSSTNGCDLIVTYSTICTGRKKIVSKEEPGARAGLPKKKEMELAWANDEKK